MKQTAVEWLINEINARDWWYLSQSMKREIIEQAKEMEKEQLKDFYFGGCSEMYATQKGFEEYYNETFKSE